MNQLTKYLLLYRRVSIPSVGTIQLMQQPAQLNVADKRIEPPLFTAEIISDETIPEHQLHYLTAALQESREEVWKSLQQLGQKLHNEISNDGFEWKGIGLLQKTFNGPFPVSASVLEPVIAERVLRQDAEHRVLVGDQQLTSSQITERKGELVVAGKHSVFMLIGWVLLILSVLYIVFILYKGKFRVGASGSKQTIGSWLHKPQQVPVKILFNSNDKA